MMKSTAILFASLCFAAFQLQAQTLEWAKGMGGSQNDNGKSMAIDAAGNVYTTGAFSDSADFDPGAGTATLVSLGTYNVFVSKLDASGNFVWAKGLTGTGWDEGNAITVDAAGNVYTIGSYEGTIDCDPGSGTYNLTAAGGNDIFISKLDASGNFIWAKSIGGSSEDYGASIAVDASGNVFAAGGFYGTVDFDPGAGTYNLSSLGAQDIFVLKLDSTGALAWAQQMGGAKDQLANSLALDAGGNVITIGDFNGTADMDPGAGVYNLTSVGDADIFISKLDASGNFVWAESIGGPKYQTGSALAVDALGNILSTGRIFGTADFDPGPNSFNLTSAGYSDVFVSKFNASGNFVWAGIMTGDDYDYGHSIAADVQGNVYLSGYFKDTVDFDPGPSVYNLTSIVPYIANIFVSKLDSAGNLVWAFSEGGTDIGGAIQSVAANGSGDVYTSGSFHGQVDFDPTGGQFFLLASGSGFYNDVFVQKLNQVTCNNTSGTISATACGSFTSPSGNYTWTASGTYTDTIANAAGCDSVITVNLTINTVDVSVTNNSPTLTANAMGAAYQWLDCDDNYAVIPGATSQSYLAGANGDYAVAVTQNGCTDTSACEAVVGLSVSDMTMSHGIDVFPNPATGQFSITLPWASETNGEAQLELINSLGQSVFTDNVQISRREVRLEVMPAGISSGLYLVKVAMGSNTFYGRVVFQR